MKFKKLRLFCFFVFLLSFAVAIFYPNLSTFAINETVYLSNDEFDNGALFSSPLLKTTSGESVATATGETKQIDIKLFGLIKLKTITVETFENENMLVGGNQIGIVADANGLIVLENYPAFGLKKGDILTYIVASSRETPLYIEADLNSFLETNNEDFKFKFVRNGKTRESKLISRGKMSGENLGIWVKDKTSAVGILTYINPENNNFGALGHALTDPETGAKIDAKSGKVFRPNFGSLEKSTQKHIGIMNASINKRADGDGVLHFSGDFGVFGCLNENSALFAETQKIYPIASRYSVKAGAATLIASLDGGAPEEYEIEIIKPKFQLKPNGKSMLVRITDPALIEKTGGIIRGMSGSPIIQNGHLIGALTHAIKNDPQKGFATYIDFMLR